MNQVFKVKEIRIFNKTKVAVLESIDEGWKGIPLLSCELFITYLKEDRNVPEIGTEFEISAKELTPA